LLSNRNDVSHSRNILNNAFVCSGGGENNDMNNSFFSKVAGVTYGDRQLVAKSLRVGERLLLLREPTNIYDKNAIKVLTLDNRQVGYIASSTAVSLAYQMDKGKSCYCLVEAVTGGGMNNYGVNIKIIQE